MQLILKVLAKIPRTGVGDAWVSGQVIQGFTNLSPPEINDAVSLLRESRLVEVRIHFGMAPFMFASVQLTARGRLTIEQSQSSKQTNSQALIRATGDEQFMRRAIEESKKSKDENDGRVHPKVGAVIVKDGNILVTAYRGEIASGDHAEYTALERKLGDKNLAGTTIFTTLEPCTKRGHEKTPCAERIILRHVGRVVIGMLDPNPAIQGKGVYKLKIAGIEVAFCSRPLENEVKQLNEEFVRDQSSSETSNRNEDVKVKRKRAKVLSKKVYEPWQQVMISREGHTLYLTVPVKPADEFSPSEVPVEELRYFEPAQEYLKENYPEVYAEWTKTTNLLQLFRHETAALMANLEEAIRNQMKTTYPLLEQSAKSLPGRNYYHIVAMSELVFDEIFRDPDKLIVGRDEPPVFNVQRQQGSDGWISLKGPEGEDLIDTDTPEYDDTKLLEQTLMRAATQPETQRTLEELYQLYETLLGQLRTFAQKLGPVTEKIELEFQ
jgi:pyrimidine deaminase RibD-like protein